MIKITLRAWGSKPRTVLRSIKPGDLFVFQLKTSLYGAGRIISRVSFGHVAEIFDCELSSPVLEPAAIPDFRRKGDFVVLDSYTLFDKRFEGDWQIVGHEDGFEPLLPEDAGFGSGVGSGSKKIDLLGNETPISASEAAKLPPYSPKGDGHIKLMFGINPDR